MIPRLAGAAYAVYLLVFHVPREIAADYRAAKEKR